MHNVSVCTTYCAGDALVLSMLKPSTQAKLMGLTVRKRSIASIGLHMYAGMHACVDSGVQDKACMCSRSLRMCVCVCLCVCVCAVLRVCRRRSFNNDDNDTQS